MPKLLTPTTTPILLSRAGSSTSESRSRGSQPQTPPTPRQHSKPSSVRTGIQVQKVQAGGAHTRVEADQDRPIPATGAERQRRLHTSAELTTTPSTDRNTTRTTSFTTSTRLDPYHTARSISELGVRMILATQNPTTVNPPGSGLFWVLGLVAVGGVEGEFSEFFARIRVDDSDVAQTAFARPRVRTAYLN